jgi:hypothetical protein
MIKYANFFIVEISLRLDLAVTGVQPRAVCNNQQLQYVSAIPIIFFLTSQCDPPKKQSLGATARPGVHS